MKAEWRDLVGYEGLYRISDQGEVWSERRQRMLSTKPNKYHGRAEFCVVGPDGKQKTLYLHQQVMRAFEGPAPQGQVVRHLDGDSANNNVKNLAYGTQQDNMDDMRAEGYKSASRLSFKQIEEINEKAKRGVRIKELMEEYGVGRAAIAAALSVSTLEVRRELMLKCIQAGCTVNVVGEYFDVTHAAISHMIKRYYGGVRALRKAHKLNSSLTVKHIPHIIGLA